MTGRTFGFTQGVNGHYEIALQVENFSAVDIAFEKVVSKGAVPVLEPSTMGQRTCYISDPEGNLIEIGSFNQN